MTSKSGCASRGNLAKSAEQAKVSAFSTLFPGRKPDERGRLACQLSESMEIYNVTPSSMSVEASSAIIAFTNGKSSRLCA